MRLMSWRRYCCWIRYQWVTNKLTSSCIYKSVCWGIYLSCPRVSQPTRYYFFVNRKAGGGTYTGWFSSYSY